MRYSASVNYILPEGSVVAVPDGTTEPTHFVYRAQMRFHMGKAGERFVFMTVPAFSAAKSEILSHGEKLLRDTN